MRIYAYSTGGNPSENTPTRSSAYGRVHNAAYADDSPGCPMAAPCHAWCGARPYATPLIIRPHGIHSFTLIHSRMNGAGGVATAGGGSLLCLTVTHAPPDARSGGSRMAFREKAKSCSDAYFQAAPWVFRGRGR